MRISNIHPKLKSEEVELIKHYKDNDGYIKEKKSLKKNDEHIKQKFMNIIFILDEYEDYKANSQSNEKTEEKNETT